MKLNPLVSSTVHGAIIHMFPGVLKGLMREFVIHIDFNDAVKWVEEKRNLWEELPDNYRMALKEYAPQLGDLSWLNAEWLVESCRERNSALASLFISWPEAQEWLEKEIENIKEQSCQKQPS